MPTGIITTKIRRQPRGQSEIDWDNPITKGLVFFVYGDCRVDLVKKRKGKLLTGALGTRNGKAGLTPAFANNKSLSFGRDAALEPPQMTMWVHGARTSTNTNSYHVPICKTYGNETAPTYVSLELAINKGAAGQVGVSADLGYSGGYLSGTETAALPAVGVPYTIATSYDLTALKTYCGGKLLSSNTRTSAMIYDATSTGQLILNGSSSATDRNLGSHDMYAAAVWNRPLTTAELKSLDANPWQLIKPRRTLFLVQGSSLPATATGGAIASGSATATVQVALSALAVAVAGGSAAAGASIPLSAAGVAVANGAAGAVATVTISASGLAQAAGQAGLSASVLLSAAGAALASGNATLAAQLAALASGAAQAGGSANLTSSAPGSIAATGGDVAGGSAVLSVSVQLAATGGDTASGSATAGAGATASASGGDVAGGSATGGATAAATAVGGDTASGSAALKATVLLTAAGFIQAMGNAALVVQIPLAASGAAQAGGSAQGNVYYFDQLFPNLDGDITFDSLAVPVRIKSTGPVIGISSATPSFAIH